MVGIGATVLIRHAGVVGTVTHASGNLLKVKALDGSTYQVNASNVDLARQGRTATEHTNEIAADRWLKDVSSKVAALKDENRFILAKKSFTDRARRELKNGGITQAKYDDLASRGSILDAAGYEAARAIEQQIEDVRNTELPQEEN